MKNKTLLLLAVLVVLFWTAAFATNDFYVIPVRSGALEARIAHLEDLLANVTRVGNDLTFSGVNVHIVNGTGTTEGPVNGLGNLIVGYNELRGNGDDRTGSHNIVVGQRHNYSSYGGLVAGCRNTIYGANASVSGGYDNTASGPGASVSGGSSNTASGGWSSVSGGYDNTASGLDASVSGGYGNEVIGWFASVSGGSYNTASGPWASVSGGSSNTASGSDASVSGGYNNTASNYYASVSGGYQNEAGGYSSSVSGGLNRSVSDSYDWRAGTYFQTD